MVRRASGVRRGRSRRRRRRGAGGEGRGGGEREGEGEGSKDRVTGVPTEHLRLKLVLGPCFSFVSFVALGHGVTNIYDGDRIRQ